jgi:DsbC/DsbD-like thiol-disulfide interchange protein
MRLATIALATALAVCATRVPAGEMSAWDGDARSAVRLIAGAARDDEGGRAIHAGVEIRLAPGWKTYWRYPGDSGVPPRFDFTGSENLAKAEVLWPAPHRFTDDGGTSIGYKQGVVFPLRVTRRDPAKPMTLRLKLDYAVCEKLCVPAQGNVEAGITGAAAENKSILDAAEARVPKKAGAEADALRAKALSAKGLDAKALGAKGSLALVSARRVSGGAKPLVAVDVKAPEGRDAELFVEGPTPDWALPVPQPAQGAPAGHRHFGFELDGLPPSADPKGDYAFTFTLVSGGEAIEVTTHLD